MPTDLFYSSFGQMDWGTGDPTETLQLTPDVACTRTPVRSNYDTNTFVQEIISYEKGEKKDFWTKKVLMSGTKMSPDTIPYFTLNDTIVSDAQLYGEKIYNQYIKPYWSCNRYRFYDTWTDFPQQEFYDFTKPNIINELSNQYLIVNVDTHGSTTSWSTEKRNPMFAAPNINTTSFNVSAASSVINAGNTIIVTSACWTNAFDRQITSLSEAFMRNPYGGILGYLGCSRYGWYYPGSMILGPSCQLNAYFYKELFTSKEKQFGKAVKNTKIKWINVNNCNTFDYVYRWLLFGVNPLGDPEMPLFTEYPKSFSNISISYTDSTLSVNAGLDSCRICVMSSNDVGNTYYQVEDVVSNATFTIPSNTYSVCVTKPGYIPYRAIVCNGNYIQNESFDCDTYVYSGQLSIGSDVTTAKPNGPVIIENGKTEIKATNSVYIKNDFEVKHGAYFSIRTGNPN